MRRREFMTVLGCAAAWSLVARAQQAVRLPRIGVLMTEEDNVEMRARLAGLRHGLERLGWSEGQNIQVDYRFAEGKPSRFQPLAKELVALQPGVIVAQAPVSVIAVQRETGVIPTVFVDVADPIGFGFVASLARPSGNLTGLVTFEASIVGKWLAMLKEIEPGLTRVALVGDSKTGSFEYFRRAAAAAAPSLGIDLVPHQVETASNLSRAIELFARVSNGGLLFFPDATLNLHRDLVTELAARHRLPAVYPFRWVVARGGLMSYTIGYVYEYRQAASYVHRILRGAKPADIPVQAPTKFETILNLKTAKTLGFTVPPGLLVAADEVIE
jgi:putative ABC transport system substrate-binding protein